MAKGQWETLRSGQSRLKSKTSGVSQQTPSRSQAEHKKTGQCVLLGAFEDQQLEAHQGGTQHWTAWESTLATLQSLSSASTATMAGAKSPSSKGSLGVSSTPVKSTRMTETANEKLGLGGGSHEVASVLHLGAAPQSSVIPSLGVR